MVLRVAICTNRDPAAIVASLDSVTGVDELIVVASGRDPAAYEREGATVLHEPRGGLSRARNVALAACGDGDVLAFLDDDALAGDGWAAGMRAAWADAPAGTACVGGPIRARFEHARPAWLSDRLLPALTTLDLGPEPCDLDPRVTTVYGANVAFRAGPLRDVGGFDPVLGHGGRPAGFGEEDEAERALARAGHGVRYDPRPWVWHVIDPARTTPAAFLRRRHDYGVGLGTRRGRSAGRAAAQALTSAAGAPLALARGDSTLAMERATRVAENAGVLRGHAYAATHAD